MPEIIKYLKLPMLFSAEKMQEEVQAISANWIAHYNKRDYEGSWTALPLRSVNGRTDHVIADAGSSVFGDTIFLQQSPYLRSVIDALPCEKNAVRLLNLQAGAIIKEHTDKELFFESGEARIHVPVLTNPDVSFFIEDERVVMNEGECWYMNFNMKHRVTNAGHTDRIHLVMDCIVNDELRKLFNSDDVEIIRKTEAPEKYSAAEKEAIINSLLAMNTPTSLQMAEEMGYKER